MLDASIPLSGRSPQFMTLGDTLKLAGDLQSDAQQKKLRQQAIAENDFQTQQRAIAMQGDQRQREAWRVETQPPLQSRNLGGIATAPPGQVAPQPPTNTLGSLGTVPALQPSGPMALESPEPAPSALGADFIPALDALIRPKSEQDQFEAVKRNLSAQGDYAGVARVDQQQTAALKDKLDRIKMVTDYVKTNAVAMNTPQNWANGRAAIVAIDPKYAAIPEQFSPENYQKLLQGSQTASEALKQYEAFTLKPGDVRFDAGGKQIAAVPEKPPAAPAGFTLAPGGSRFDAQGNKIASLPPLPTRRATGNDGVGPFGSVAPTIQGAAASGQGMGEDALKGLTPQEANLVKSMVDYKRPIPSGVALTRGDWPKYLLIAHAYDPAFDENQYANRKRLRDDMLSGKSSQNIKSFNTAIRHLQTFQKAGEALKNVDFQPANAVKNYVSEKMGGAAPTNFLNAANAVAAEAATAFKGIAGTDQEIKAWRSGLSPNMSNEQIDGAVQTITELLAGRIAETSEQYARGMGKPKDFHFLSDESRSILGKRKVDVNKIDPMGAATDPAASLPPPAATGGGTVKMSLGGVEKDVAPGRVEAIKAMGGTVVGQVATSAGPAANPQKAQLEQQIRALAAQVQAERDPAKQAALKAQGQRLLQQFDAVK